MKYTSKDGCLFYYDRVLFKWQLADPTMLFMLGLEAVTTYSVSVSDALTIANQTYIKDTNEYGPFEYFDIYDDIHNYLSQIVKVEDRDTYLITNVDGLKLTINELTGTQSDRTVPIIFKNDINAQAIDLSKPTLRIPSNLKQSYSYYDLQAEKLIDIFNDAGFTSSDTDPLSEERSSNSQIYRLLDFKAMYSYALGVLYGCRCLGYSPKLIWRLDPKYWYNNELINLVRTAWYTFRFHHSTVVNGLDSDEDIDKYKGIAYNKLWNFGLESDKLIDDTARNPLHANEQQSVVLSIEKDSDNLPIKINSNLVNYDTDNHQYLTFDLHNNQIEWHEATELRADEGIVPYNDSSIIRYLGMNKVVAFKSYDNVTDPNTNKYFISSGMIGWVDNLNGELQETPIESGKSEQYALDKNTKMVVSFIQASVDTPAEQYIYGVPYNSNTGYSDKLLDSATFHSLYTELSSSSIPAGYTEVTHYDLTIPVKLYVNGGDVWDNDEEIVTTISDIHDKYGYSATPASEVYGYVKQSGDNVIDVDIRYCNNLYWPYTNNGTISWNNKIDPNFYKKLGTVDLYAGTKKLAREIQIYSNNSSPEDIFIFNDGSIPEIAEYFNTKKFITLNNSNVDPVNIYNKLGITTYLCPVITQDDLGNSLLDSNGNYQVWYDEKEEQYWSSINGYNHWNKYKPAFSTAQMYDIEQPDRGLAGVLDNYDSKTVTINGTIYTYDEFYGMSTALYAVAAAPVAIESEPTQLLVRLKLENIVQTDDQYHTYNFYDSEYEEIILNGDILATMASDDDETFIFVSVSSETNELSDFNHIKYISIDE